MSRNNNPGGNQIADMRSMLFNQLTRLSDPNCNLEKEVQRTKAMTDVTKQLVDSAKVEVDFLRITGGKQSEFLPGLKQLGDGGGNS